MKKEITSLTVGALAFLFISGCNSELKNGPSDPNQPGTETTVEVKLIMPSTSPFARAAGGTTSPAEGDELEINTDVYIFVYNSSNLLERVEKMDAPVANGDKKQFTVKSGTKYFYVVANQPVVTPPTEGVQEINTRKGFETQRLASTISGTAPEVLSITSPDFVMGTLWGTPIVASEGGTAANPKQLTLDIGRAAAKVKLHSVQQGAESNMKGTFTEPAYRLGSVPNIYYHVGQYDDSGTSPIVPPTANHGKVTSAVHNESWGTAGDPNVQNDKFGNYTEFINVSPVATPLTDYFYATENTTAIISGYQYYGNTTYIQLRTKYTPDATEIVDMETLEQTAQPLDQGTFYVVTIDNKDYIVPEIIATVDHSNPRAYINGINYHKFPVRDILESDPERKHTVLRNHYYEVAVTSIKNLGDPSGEVDPSEPITDNTEVEITINILPWSKISQSEDL